MSRIERLRAAIRRLDCQVDDAYKGSSDAELERDESLGLHPGDMTEQQTTDADLGNVVYDAMTAHMDQYASGAKQLRYIDETVEMHRYCQAIAEAVIAAARPIIAAQARAEGRRELAQQLLDLVPYSSTLNDWERPVVRSFLKMHTASDTGAAADGTEEPR